jgi:hypothetical protein
MHGADEIIPSRAAGEHACHSRVFLQKIQTENKLGIESRRPTVERLSDFEFHQRGVDAWAVQQFDFDREKAGSNTSS